MKVYTYNIFLIVFIFFQSCARSKQEINVSKINKIEFDSNFVKGINLTPYEIVVNSYSDSINNSINENQLPIFLKEKNIDFYSKGIWGDSIDKVSIRYKVISNVTNCVSLKLIINSSENYYKISPDKFDATQLHSNESIYTLAMIRYQQLNCK